MIFGSEYLFLNFKNFLILFGLATNDGVAFSSRYKFDVNFFLLNLKQGMLYRTDKPNPVPKFKNK